MKCLVAICLFYSFTVSAQLSFKTVAPQKPIVEGESFQVQYVLQDAKKAGVVTAPLFRGFRIVTGPNLYFGTIGTIYGEQPLHNVVYTLEAVRPGIYLIQGATVLVNGKTLRSNDIQVEIISKKEAVYQTNQDNFINSEYFLKPGEDPHKKIRDNLFVKVMVSKRSCLVGEPVLATFKLYSRLESRSDIVKNPGLYGFSVFDMVNLADREVSAEKINGKIFDVHTIRKVQLYPLQPGQFIIDAMEVKNRVEFSVSAVNKRTEQEIVEGIVSLDPNESNPPGTEVFETYTSTQPLGIQVKAVPEKNKPALFSGAMGQFSIAASTPKIELNLNEETFLKVTISGKGNFTQLDAPPLQWPAGVEGFEARVIDEVNKKDIPLSGKRSFIYPFVGIKPGNYRLPPVQFPFFDPATNRYQVVQTDSLDIRIHNQKQVIAPFDKTQRESHNNTLLLIIAGLVGVTAGVVLGLKKHRSDRRINRKQTMIPVVPVRVRANLLIDPQEPLFYAKLYDALWKMAAEKFGLKGSTMSKQELSLAMKSRNIRQEDANELLNLIGVCETGMYTSGDLEEDKVELILRGERVISSIRQT